MEFGVRARSRQRGVPGTTVWPSVTRARPRPWGNGSDRPRPLRPAARHGRMDPRRERRGRPRRPRDARAADRLTRRAHCDCRSLPPTGTHGCCEALRVGPGSVPGSARPGPASYPVAVGDRRRGARCGRRDGSV